MERPKIGVGVLIFQDDKILLGKRKNSHGSNSWAPPGGHLEFQETLQECAIREVLEETGLILDHVIKGPYTNDIFKDENKHYITIFMLAKYIAGEPKVLEIDKCESWQWFDLNNLPDQLFLSLNNLLDQIGIEGVSNLRYLLDDY